MSDGLTPSRTPRGVRELKLILRTKQTHSTLRRTPRGVRELKHRYLDFSVFGKGVAPLAGCVN